MIKNQQPSRMFLGHLISFVPLLLLCVSFVKFCLLCAPERTSNSCKDIFHAVFHDQVNAAEKVLDSIAKDLELQKYQLSPGNHGKIATTPKTTITQNRLLANGPWRPKGEDGSRWIKASLILKSRKRPMPDRFTNTKRKVVPF